MTRIVGEISNTVQFATGAPWTYNTGMVANGTALNTVIADHYDDTNTLTGVSLVTTAVFNSSVASTAYATADNSWPKEIFWVSWITANSSTPASAKFTGLPAGGTYSLKLAGQNTNGRNTTYTVNGTSLTYNGSADAANVQEPVEFTGVIAGNGELEFEVVRATAGDTYGYLSGYELVYSAATPSASIDVDIPSDIDLKWDTTYQLAVTHDGGTTTLDNVTLSAPTGWETVTFTTAPDEASTESFYEKAKTDATLGGSGYTMVAGDVLAWTTSTGLTIDGQTIPVVDPAATVTGSYKIWDDTLSTWSATSTYTITDNGIYTGEPANDATAIVQPMISNMIKDMVN